MHLIRRFMLCMIAIQHWFAAPWLVVIGRLTNRNRFYWLFLDFLLIPNALICLPLALFGDGGRKLKAEFTGLSHSRFVCRHCPSSRRQLRDVHGQGGCSWNANWNNENFQIPSSFGISNWFSQYLKKKTNLEPYKKSLPLAHINLENNPPFTRLKLYFSASIQVLLIFLMLNVNSLVYVFHTMNDAQIEWQPRGGTVQHESRTFPQGLTYVNETLFHSVHVSDQRSVLHVYDLNFTEIQSLPFPSDLTHVSGLTHDGEFLWAVDFGSRTISKFICEQENSSLECGRVLVLDSGLKTPSAITVVNVFGARHLAVSEFLHSGEISFVPLDDAHALTNNSRNFIHHAVATIPGGYFSQGLTACGTLLFESVNRAGVDSIIAYELSAWEDPLKDYDERVTKFNAPSSMVEDLATDCQRLWTSDEGDFAFFETNLSQLDVETNL